MSCTLSYAPSMSEQRFGSVGTVADLDPLFGSEQGWFGVRDDDHRGEHPKATTWRRDFDFLRRKDFALYLVDPRAGMKILDIGCAAGAQMTLCGLLGAEVYGQDLSSERIDTANRKLAKLGLAGEAKVGDVQELAYGDNEFDVVLSSDFYEHVNSEVKVRSFREALRVLKPAGRLVIKTPNLSYLRASLAYKRVRAILKGADPRQLMIPHTESTSPDAHVGLTTRQELSGLLTVAGFQTVVFHYSPLRRFGRRDLVDVLSTEVPLMRDVLCEELYCTAYKPISLSYFPDVARS